MKKIIIVQLLFLCSICSCFAQNGQKFLVFTFNCLYKVGNYKHGSGDNLWIIPYDSCRNELPEKCLLLFLLKITKSPVYPTKYISDIIRLMTIRPIVILTNCLKTEEKSNAGPRNSSWIIQ